MFTTKRNSFDYHQKKQVNERKHMKVDTSKKTLIKFNNVWVKFVKVLIKFDKVDQV